jgi:hypothetical protein
VGSGLQIVLVVCVERNFGMKFCVVHVVLVKNKISGDLPQRTSFCPVVRYNPVLFIAMFCILLDTQR